MRETTIHDLLGIVVVLQDVGQKNANKTFHIISLCYIFSHEERERKHYLAVCSNQQESDVVSMTVC